jgi:glycosyltransferase involved in cell wall biosynthesis
MTARGGDRLDLADVTREVERRPGKRLPLVSVLTPSYNQERWIGENLASVAEQTHGAIEHIVMDGGSTDGTVDLLRDRAGQHVRWLSEPDRGQSHALNKAYAASRGEFIGWLNSDDVYFDRDVVRDVVAYFERHPDADVVYGHAVLINDEGLILQVLWSPKFNPRLFRWHNFVSQPAAFIRRTALGDTFVDEQYDYTMDRELWLRLARSSSFRRMNRVVACDRHHLGRKSLARSDLRHGDMLRMKSIYKISVGRKQVVVEKVLKIVRRIIGVRLALGCSPTRGAHAQVDSRRRLLFRQVAMLRRLMPSGGARRHGNEHLRGTRVSRETDGGKASR